MSGSGSFLEVLRIAPSARDNAQVHFVLRRSFHLIALPFYFLVAGISSIVSHGIRPGLSVLTQCQASQLRDVGSAPFAPQPRRTDHGHD